jgi:hypothetical protein
MNAFIFCTTEILPGFRGGIPNVFDLPSCPGGLPCACETPSAPPAPSPTITGTSGQVMMYDDSNGATPATLGLVPSNPSFPAICYPLSGASETFTWIPSKGIWI